MAQAMQLLPGKGVQLCSVAGPFQRPFQRFGVHLVIGVALPCHLDVQLQLHKLGTKPQVHESV